MTKKQKRLSYLYTLLISTVILCMLVSQGVLQYGLKQKEADALIINLAGRQRMLSQKLTKQILLYEKTGSFPADFTSNLDTWNTVHAQLRFGDKQKNMPPPQEDLIVQKIEDLSPVQGNLYKAFLNFYTKEKPQELELILRLEPIFLSQMDSLVNAYQHSADKKLTNIMILELVAWILSILILLFEVIFIFKPTIKELNIQEARMRKISFMYSHTMRAPLTNILTLTKLTTKNNTKQEQAEYLSLLQVASKELDEKVHEVVDLSKEL